MNRELSETHRKGFERFMNDALVSYTNGIKPARYTICRNVGGLSCCVIGAAMFTFVCHGKGGVSELLFASVGCPRTKIAEQYNLNVHDVWDFVDGFDAIVDPPDDCTTAWCMGRNFSKRLFGD